MSGAFRRFGPESPFDDPFGHMRATARSFLGHTTSGPMPRKSARASRQHQAFDAFLCHSTRADGDLVAALRSELHQRSRRAFGLRRLHAFQDRYDLESGSHTLWTDLIEKLESSRHLVVILTPESTDSPGMAKEIEWWLQARGVHNLLLVALRGDLLWDPSGHRYSETGTVPLILQTVFVEEPFFYDLRGYRRNTGTGQDHTNVAVFQLLAKLLNRSVDQLRREDKTRQRFEMVLSAGAVGLLCVTAALTIFSMYQRDLNLQQDRVNGANAVAAEAVSFFDSDPGRAARLLLQAGDIEHTPQVQSAMGRLALRWSLLNGLWNTGLARPQAAALVDGMLLICRGADYWLIDLEDSGSGSAGSLEELNVPRGAQAVCRIQKAMGTSAPLLVLEYTSGESNERPPGYLGPTLYEFLGDHLRLVRQGTEIDTPELVCEGRELTGFAFVHGQRLWICEAGAVRALSSTDATMPASGSVVVSDDGALVVFVEGTRLVTHDVVEATRRVVAEEVPRNHPGRLVLSPDNRRVEFFTYQDVRSVMLSGRVVNLAEEWAGNPRTDIDAIGLAAGGEWIASSSGYSATEVARNSVVFQSRWQSFAFPRFGGSENSAVLVVTENDGGAIIVSAAGRVERYSAESSTGAVQEVLNLPIRRFQQCAAVGPDGRRVVLMSPAGYVTVLDWEGLRVEYHGYGGDTVYFSERTPQHVAEAYEPRPPEYLAQWLQARLDAARAFRVGVADVESDREGRVFAALAERGEVGLLVDGRRVDVELPEGSGLEVYRDAAFAVSPNGRLLVVPTREALLVYGIVRRAMGAEAVLGRRLRAGSAVAFSDDGELVGLATGRELHVFRVVDLENGRGMGLGRTGGGAGRVDGLALRAHASAALRLAFDREMRLIYGGGGDHRVSVHHVDTAERYDADWTTHRDRVESLCALPGGGVLSLDQHRTAIGWQLAEERIEERVGILAGLPEVSPSTGGVALD